MKKSTAATFIVNKRPNRSANRPAVIAPAAAPSRAEATAKPNAVAPTWNWSAIADTAPLEAIRTTLLPDEVSSSSK